MYVKDMFLLLIFVYLGYQGDEGDISSTEQHNLPEENPHGSSPTLSSISSVSSEYYPL